MVDLRKGVKNGSYSFEDTDGVIQVLVLKPLKTVLMPKFFSVVDDLTDITNGKKTVLTQENTEYMFDICKDVLKQSYPQLVDEDVDEFVSQHFDRLFKEIVQLNLPKGGATSEKSK